MRFRRSMGRIGGGVAGDCGYGTVSAPSVADGGGAGVVVIVPRGGVSDEPIASLTFGFSVPLEFGSIEVSPRNTSVADPSDPRSHRPPWLGPTAIRPDAL